MKTRYKVIISSVALAAAFSVGRYTVPVMVKTVETKKVDTKITKTTKKNKKIVKTEIIHPDGKKEKKTEITDDTETKVDKDKKQNETTSVERSSEHRVQIEALVGADARTPQAVYGAAVSTPILGPVVIGIWGLSNSTFGGSIGLRF